MTRVVRDGDDGRYALANGKRQRTIAVGDGSDEGTDD